MKKQLCSLLTALALAVGLLPSAARAAENAPSFADVPAAAWYADAVQYVYENGLMTGVSEARLRRTAQRRAADRHHSLASRGQSCRQLCHALRRCGRGRVVRRGRALGSLRPASLPAIPRAASARTTPLRREQLAAILYRYIKTQGQGLYRYVVLPTAL